MVFLSEFYKPIVQYIVRSGALNLIWYAAKKQDSVFHALISVRLTLPLFFPQIRMLWNLIFLKV